MAYLKWNLNKKNTEPAKHNNLTTDLSNYLFGKFFSCSSIQLVALVHVSRLWIGIIMNHLTWVKWFPVTRSLTLCSWRVFWIESEKSLWWVTGSGRLHYLWFSSSQLNQTENVAGCLAVSENKSDTHAHTFSAQTQQPTNWLACLALFCLLALTRSRLKVAFITTNT